MAEPQLTKNQSLVLEALDKSAGPMSAYTILDELRDQGFRAPLQVYRAIDKLQDLGLVHRLESLNAFVACKHPSCGSHETMIFMICKDCGKVEEVSDEKLGAQLESSSATRSFTLSSSVVELRGHCKSCKH